MRIDAAPTFGEDARVAPVVTIDGLTKRYGRHVALDALSLRVGAGTIFGFLGPNGAGKTTTIRCLLGMLRPTAGRAALFGHDCWREGAVARRRVGTIAGDLRLDATLTVERGIALLAQVRGPRTADGARSLREEGAALAGRLGLAPDVPVRDMSRGMRQKLGLILALAPRPPLLILDEPTTALDPIVQRDLVAILRERAREDGATVFFSSHTLSEVEDLCDRVAILRRGRLVVEESIDSLRRRAPRVATLTWRDGMAPPVADAPPLLELRVVRDDGHAWEARLTGPSGDVVRWAASRGEALVDLDVRPPDLEDLFHRYYDDDDASASATGQPRAGEEGD